MPRVVFLAGEPDWLGPSLREAAGRRPYAFLTRDSSADAMAAALQDAEALVALPGDVPVVQPACPNLRFVQFTSCDFDQKALAELHAIGIVAAGLGATLAGDMATVALGLILAIATGSRAPLKPSDDSWQPALETLRGRTVGIIGLGRAGAAVARLLKPSGARLLYSDIRTTPQGVAAQLGIRRATQDRVLIESDFATIHVPVTEQTKSGIGRREFTLIGKGTALVNTSAPEVVDRQALVSALKDGRIRGYGTTDLDPGLAGLPNVVMADPKTLQSLPVAAKVAAWIVDNVDAALEGRRPQGLLETIGYPKAGDPAFWSSRIAPRVEGS